MTILLSVLIIIFIIYISFLENKIKKIQSEKIDLKILSLDLLTAFATIIDNNDKENLKKAQKFLEKCKKF